MASPTRRGSRWVPPKPGMIPRLISGWPKLADSAAIRKSQAMASSHPPPKANALTAATVATEERSMSRRRPCMASSSSAPAAASILVNALMSAPAQNSIGLADANTTARVPAGRRDRVPGFAQRLHDLGGDRVGRRAVQPDDGDLVAGLELDRALLPARVRARVGEEALAGLDAEAALDVEAAKQRRGLKAPPPTPAPPPRACPGPRRGRPGRHGPAAGGMIPAPAIMPRSMSFIAATPSSRTRQLSTRALRVKRSTRASVSMD